MTPPRSRASLRPALSLPLAAAALVLLLAGCGSSHPIDNVDPASAVPAAAPLYAEAVVRPEGSLKEDTNSAARTLTGMQDPFGRLVHSLESSGALGHYNYARDIKPWLGRRAAMFLTALPSGAGSAGAAAPSTSQELSLESLLAATGIDRLTGAGAQGAVVLDAADPSKAQASLAAVASRTGAHTVTYRGVSYQVNGEGLAQAVIGHLAVIGSESAVRAAIDARKGAPSLQSNAAYSKLSAAGEQGAVASLYVEGRALARGAAAVPALGLLGALLQGASQARIALIPAKSSLTLDADTLGESSPGAAGQSAGEAQQALASLPEASWLGLGVPALGPRLGSDLTAARTLFGAVGGSLSQLGGAALSGVLGRLTAHAEGLQHDFASWAGPAALFASGTGLLNLQGAVVIKSRDPAGSRAAVGRLAHLLRQAGASVTPATIPGTDAAVSVRLSGLPLGLAIADGQGKFVIGLGSSSVTAALSPSGSLSASPTYRSAQATLGSGFKPSLVLQFPTIAGLIEGLGLSQSPGFSQVLGFLRPLGTLVGGQQQLGGGVSRFRLVLGLVAHSGQEGETEGG